MTKFARGKFAGLPMDYIELEHDPLHVRLQKPLHYFARDGSVHTVSVGFVTDFSSIPWWMQWLFPRWASHKPSGAMHDKLCREDVGEGLMTKARADYLFRESLASKEVNLPTWRRWVMWAAVRIAGWYVRYTKPGIKSAWAWLWAWFTALVSIVSAMFKPRPQRRVLGGLMGFSFAQFAVPLAFAAGVAVTLWPAKKFGEWIGASRENARVMAEFKQSGARAKTVIELGNEEADRVDMTASELREIEHARDEALRTLEAELRKNTRDQCTVPVDCLRHDAGGHADRAEEDSGVPQG